MFRASERRPLFLGVSEGTAVFPGSAWDASCRRRGVKWKGAGGGRESTAPTTAALGLCTTPFPLQCPASASIFHYLGHLLAHPTWEQTARDDFVGTAAADLAIPSVPHSEIFDGEPQEEEMELAPPPAMAPTQDREGEPR